MAKIITDDGATATALKPLRLPTYHPRQLPDAAACTHAVIVINDSADPSKGRLAVSNGQSWDKLARVDDAVPPPVNLAPLVRSAVAEMLPARLVPPVEVKTIATVPANEQDTAAIAQALLEMSEAINRLQNENFDLQQRVAFLEDNALARAQLIREAS